MRIVENSPTALRLQETSGWLPALLAGAAVAIVVYVAARHADPRQLINAGLFAVATVFFRRVSGVELDKRARTLRLSRVDMWRRSERTVAFGEITDVQVELMRPDTSSQSHSRLTVITPAGAVPLTAGFAPGLDRQIALREAMVEVVFAGRARPAPLDPVQVLRDGGRPLAAAMRA